MKVADLPALFIASSSEGLSVAYDLQEALEFDCHATVWKQGVFEPSRTVLEDLLSRLKTPQFALFVFTPDDTLILRGQTHRVTRDNVVFEMGLFIGAFGLARCMHILPRGAIDLQLPSDLLGLTALDYPADRPDGNRLAALGPACNRIRRRLRDFGSDLPLPGPAAAAVIDAASERAQRMLQFMASWTVPPLLEDRARLRAGFNYDPTDPDFPRVELRRTFNFLESLSDAVLSGALDEAQARRVFGESLVAFWPIARTLLAPPNHFDEYWQQQPRIAELYVRWR